MDHEQAGKFDFMKTTKTHIETPEGRMLAAMVLRNKEFAGSRPVVLVIH